MTILDFAPRTTSPDVAGLRPRVPGVAVIPLHDDLWRVTRHDGEVLGYVERSASGSGVRFTAKRMLQRQRRFVAIGEFWTIDDALDCFRF